MQITSRTEAIQLGLSKYFTGEPCKRDHISERTVSNSTCCECSRIFKRNYKKTEAGKAAESKYNKANRKKINDTRRKLRNTDEYRAKRRAERDLSKEREANKARMKQVRCTDEYRAKAREWQRLRKLRDPSNHKAKSFMYSCIRRLVLGGIGKSERTEKMLGYTKEELISKIESQFSVGMNWDNYGDWHIDHIKPMSLFLKEGVTDPSVINALSNLQPLWAEDNLSKGCRYE